MKVIVTGFTADSAVGNSRVGFESLPLGLMRAAESLGWDAVQKPMRVASNDTDLDTADVMFVGLGPFNAVGSRYMFGAMDAIAKAKSHGCALAMYVTDWQTHLLNTSVRTMLKKPHNMAKFFMRARTDYLWGAHNIPYLEWILQSFESRPWPETIVPMQTWHTRPDRDQRILKHIPARRITTLDPTQITTAHWEIEPPDWTDKKRQYVCAALGDYTQWMGKQKFGWPVEYRGGKTHVEVEGSDNRVLNKRITEQEVNELYRESFIGLCPKTPMFATGWWRTRYDFITRCGAILYGEPAEIGVIGDHFGYTTTQLEEFTNDQLIALARVQREEYERQIEPEDSVLGKIHDVAIRAIEDLK